MKLKNGDKTIQIKDYQKTSPLRFQTSAKWRSLGHFNFHFKKRKDKNDQFLKLAIYSDNF